MVLPHMPTGLGGGSPDTLATRFAIAQEMAVRGDHAGAAGRVSGRVRGQAATLGPDYRTR